MEEHGGSMTSYFDLFKSSASVLKNHCMYITITRTRLYTLKFTTCKGPYRLQSKITTCIGQYRPYTLKYNTCIGPYKIHAKITICVGP